eukprot:jgi/Botrbrau1/11149/Bobra.182_2s0004.1
MELLVRRFVEELALEGSRGATVRTVWSRLQDEVHAQYGFADPALKQAIWEDLSRSDVTFMEGVKEAEAGDAGQDSAQAPKRKKARLTIETRSETQPEQRVLKELDHSNLPQILDDTIEANVVLVASLEWRNAAIGFTDQALSTSVLTACQRKAVEEIARTRTAGILRTHLAVDKMGLQSRDFHHILKTLEAKRLVARRICDVVKPSGIVATELLFLARFAPPELPMGYKLEVDESGEIKRVKQTLAPQLKATCDLLAAAPEKTMLLKELKAELSRSEPINERTRRQILSTLHSEGYVQYITAKIPVDVRQQYSSIKKPKETQLAGVTLLKPYPGSSILRGPTPGKGEEGDGEGVLEPEGTNQLQALQPLKVEEGVTERVLTALTDAGPEGICQSRFAGLVGMSHKRANKLMVRISEDMKIPKSTITVGRTTTRVWVRTDEIRGVVKRKRSTILRGAQTIAQVEEIAAIPVVNTMPCQAELVGTARVAHSEGHTDIQAGTEAVATLTLGDLLGPAEAQHSGIPAPTGALVLTAADLLGPIRSSGSLTQSGKLPSEEEHGDSKAEQDDACGACGPAVVPVALDVDLPLVPEADPETDGVTIAQGTEPNTTITPPATGRVKRAIRGSALNEDDKVADLMKDATITNVGVEYEKSLERQSDTQKKRLDLLEKRLQTEPVVLQIDIAKWLQAVEAVETKVDKKTVVRLVKHMVHESRASNVLVWMPGIARTTNKLVKIEALVRAGVAIDTALKEKILRLYLAYMKGRAFHTKTLLRERQALRVGRKVTEWTKPEHVQRVENLMHHEPLRFLTTRDAKDGGGKAWTTRTSGWLWRAQMLHQFILECMGWDGECNHDFLYTFSKLLGPPDTQNLTPGHNLEETAPDMSEGSKGTKLFSTRLLVESLPLARLCEIVGSQRPMPIFAATSSEQSTKRVGEFTEDEQASFLDSSTLNRASKLMYILQRLDLVKVVTTQVDSTSVTSVMQFLAARTGRIQDPSAEGDKKDAPFLVYNFDKDPGACKAYWDCLACLATRIPRGASKCVAPPLQGCFPATVCPDVLDFKAWIAPVKPSLEQAVKLRDALKGLDLNGLDWKAYGDLAVRTGMKPANIFSIVNQVRYKVRRLEGVGKGRSRLNASNSARRKRYAKVKGPKARPVLSPETLIKRHQYRVETWAKFKQCEARVAREMEEEQERLHSSKNTSQDTTSRVPILLQLKRLTDSARRVRLSKPDYRSVTRKFMWHEMEDRVLLTGYIRFHIYYGFPEGSECYTARQNRLPCTELSERQARRRIGLLQTDPQTRHLLEHLDELTKEVHSRIKDRPKPFPKAFDGITEEMLDKAMLVGSTGASLTFGDKKRKAMSGNQQYEAPDIFMFKDDLKYLRARARALSVLIAVGDLFPAVDDEERSLLESLEKAVEDIIVHAPKRIIAGHVRAGAPVQAGSCGIRNAGGGAPEDRIQGSVARMVQHSRSANLYHHLQWLVGFSRKALDAPEQAPTPPVATAMELIRSMLYASERKEESHWLDALDKRYSPQQIADAFSHLQNLQQIYKGAARRPYQLADKFRHNLLKSHLPSHFFADVAHAHAQVEGVFAKPLPVLAELRDSSTLEIDLQEMELPMGLLAELLTRRACKKASFRLLDAQIKTIGKSSVPGSTAPPGRSPGSDLNPRPVRKKAIAGRAVPLGPGATEQQSSPAGRASASDQSNAAPLAHPTGHPTAQLPMRYPQHGTSESLTSPTSQTPSCNLNPLDVPFPRKRRSDLEPGSAKKRPRTTFIVVESVATNPSEVDGPAVPAGNLTRRGVPVKSEDNQQQTALQRKSRNKRNGCQASRSERQEDGGIKLVTQGLRNAQSGQTQEVMESNKAIACPVSPPRTSPNRVESEWRFRGVAMCMADGNNAKGQQSPVSTRIRICRKTNKRLYSPAEVRGSPECARAAQEACRQALAQAEERFFPESWLEQHFSRILRSICHEGDVGVTVQRVADILFETGESRNVLGSSVSGIPDARDLKMAQLFSRYLRAYGLLCRVPGFNSWVYVSSEHASLYLVTVPAKGFGPLQSCMQRSDERASIPLLRRENLPHVPIGSAEERRGGACASQGQGDINSVDNAIHGRHTADATSGPCEDMGGSKEVLMMPWLDLDGQLNRPYWRALVQRAVGIVVRHPGAPEAAVVNELQELINPHSARQLLNVLALRRIIKVQHVTDMPCGPPLLLRNPSAPAPVAKVVRHYFPNTRWCWSKASSVLPL